MEEFKQTYLKKCTDLACKPIDFLESELDKALQEGVVLEELALNGNQKQLFNARVQPMQVCVLVLSMSDGQGKHGSKRAASFESSCLTLSWQLNSANSHLLRQMLFQLKTEPSQHSLLIILLQTVLAVCEALQTDVNVRSLDLANNFLNDLAAQAVASLIKSDSSIQSINLAGNNIGPQGAVAICKALSAPGCRLQQSASNQLMTPAGNGSCNFT
eukprot:scaffold256297_cov21-Tisochrysis_lutea.AAC.3